MTEPIAQDAGGTISGMQLSIRRRWLRPAVIGYLIMALGLGYTLYRQETERCVTSQVTRQDIIDGLDTMVYELTNTKPGQNAELDGKIARANRELPQPPKTCR